MFYDEKNKWKKIEGRWRKKSIVPALKNMNKIMGYKNDEDI